MMLDRQNDLYGRYPLKSAFDGGFSSQKNLKKAKSKKGLKDICFSKGRGLKVKDMCRSNWVYKQLRNFRAGIESGISWLKRSLGRRGQILKKHILPRPRRSFHRAILLRVFRVQGNLTPVILKTSRVV